jgi:hypothetical protein
LRERGIVGAVRGDEVPTAGEDGAMTVVAGVFAVEVHVVEEGLRIHDEPVVEGVLGSGGREVGAVAEGEAVVLVPGDVVKFFLGEAVFGEDLLHALVGVVVMIVVLLFVVGLVAGFWVEGVLVEALTLRAFAAPRRRWVWGWGCVGVGVEMGAEGRR